MKKSPHRRWRTVLAVAASLPLPLVLVAGGTAAASTSASSSSTLEVSGGNGGPWATNFNPLSAGSPTLSGDTGISSLVYESLLQFNYANSSQVIPWLATKYAWSDAGKTLTFTIRKGVKWSDGKPFTATDVAYTFNLLKKFPSLNLSGIVFTKATAVNPTTVVITQPTANYSNLYYIASQQIVPQHVWSKIKNPVDFLNTGTTVTTGPYTLKSISPQNIILTRNPDYWGKEPAVATVEFPAFFSNATADEALIDNQAGWGAPFLTDVKSFTSSGNGHHVYWFPPVSDVMLVPNTKQYPLNLLPFRQAINEVLNRPAFAHNADLNEEGTITNPTGLILPRDASSLAPQYKNSKFKVDLADGKAKLMAAGFTYKGTDLYAPNGTAVKLTVQVDGGFSDWVAGAPTLVQNLDSLGIQATLQAPSNAVYISNLATGSFDLSLWTQFASGPGPFYQFDEFLDSAFTAPIGKSAASNYGRWNDPATDAALSAYAQSDQPAVQQKAMYAIEKIMVNQVPLFPLEYQVAFGEDNTSQFTGWPTPSNPYATLSPYVGNSNELVILHLKPVK
jgi:peptide/nickel transport system substrate-binding protein